MKSTTESSDYSGKAILLSNGFAILLALFQGWTLYPLLVIYWCQSVVIGAFNVARILRLEEYSTKYFSFGDLRVEKNREGRIKTAVFFAMHFGFFHLAYLVFLGTGASGFIESLEGNKSLISEIFWMLFAVAGFLVSHWFSFRKNVEADLAGDSNIGMIMFLPYLRVVPMHLTILAGGAIGSSGWVLLIFMSLKTLADYLMHIVEHRIMRRLRQSETNAAR